jgi:hypothetical protein
MRTAAEMSTGTPRSAIPPLFSLGKELTKMEPAKVKCDLDGELGPFNIEVARPDLQSGREDTVRTFLLGVRTLASQFFIISAWLSLFSSEVSMLADIGRFAQASSPAN